MADILFVHSNFPGQFGYIAHGLAQRGHRVMAIGSTTAGRVKDVEIARYTPPISQAKGVRSENARRLELDLLRADAAARVAIKLRDGGFDPAVIIAHPAWGETALLREVFPRAKRLMHGEFYIATEEDELSFDPEMGPWTLDDRLKARASNLTLAQAYLEADAIVCPTPYQAGVFPEVLRPRIRIIHEGVDTQTITPNAAAAYTLPDGRRLDRNTPLITYVSRKLEPLRGFHTFMRALPATLEALPTAQALVVGVDEHGYGFRPPPGNQKSWGAKYRAEIRDRADMDRIHFTGRLPYEQMLAALQASAAHVYYTYPFVLSWSLLEAMAAGALIVASDTKPVRDVIVEGENGLLGDFFDADLLANRLIMACRHPAVFQPLRDAARRTVVESYDRDSKCLPAWFALVDELLAA